jgi:hypothetical protein
MTIEPPQAIDFGFLMDIQPWDPSRPVRDGAKYVSWERLDVQAAGSLTKLICFQDWVSCGDMDCRGALVLAFLPTIKKVVGKRLLLKVHPREHDLVGAEAFSESILETIEALNLTGPELLHEVEIECLGFNRYGEPIERTVDQRGRPVDETAPILWLVWRAADRATTRVIRKWARSGSDAKECPTDPDDLDTLTARTPRRTHELVEILLSEVCRDATDRAILEGRFAGHSYRQIGEETEIHPKKVERRFKQLLTEVEQRFPEPPIA